MSETAAVSVPADPASGIPSDDATPATPAAAAPRLPRDPWIATATYTLLAAIAVVGAWLGWNYYTDAHLAATQSNSARAVSNLSAIVDKAPTDAQARVRLAEALMANGQTAEAKDQLQTALRLDPENVAGLTDTGLIQMAASDWKSAEATWRKLESLLSGQEMSLKDQRLANTYYYLGTTLVEETRFVDAVASLQKSISIRRDSSSVHYMLSVAFQRLQRTADQRSELETVLAFDPKHAQANYDLGMLDMSASQEATAAELFRIAADNAPSGITEPQTQLARFGSAKVRLATAQKYRISDPERALGEARIAAALDPNDTAAVALVAGLWDLTGDPSRSLNAWQRLLELDPGNADAAIAIARLGADAR